MQELIERLEKAPGPDINLDAEIWMTLHPQWHNYTRADTSERIVWITPDGPSWLSTLYTHSIDAALTLVPDGWTRAVDATAPECGIDVELFKGGKERLKGTHESEAIATCIAALKARQHVKDGEG